MKIGDKEPEVGRVPDGTRLSSTTEPASSLGPAGFDPSRFDPSRGPLEAAAEAIYGAIDPLSGDSISAVIHMSDHLFWDNIEGYETDIASQLGAVRAICRVAAEAAIAGFFRALPSNRDSDGSPKGGDAGERLRA